MKSKDTPKPNPLLMDEIGHWDFPKEEPKQETLEEAATKYLRTLKGVNYRSIYDFSNQQTLAFMYGAKWQQERSYSEEDMKSAFKVGFSIGYGSDVHAIDEKNRTCEEWFEQLKKK